MHITTREVVVAIGDVLYYIELEFIVYIELYILTCIIL